jgi:hypothetical protein
LEPIYRDEKLNLYEDAEKHRRAIRCRFGPIVHDPAASRKFYSEALGLEFKEDTTGYLYTGELGSPSSRPQREIVDTLRTDGRPTSQRSHLHAS